MFEIELLPADYGDALLVRWGTAGKEWRMLIDGGLRGSARAVGKRLRALDGPLDLLVVTHVDRDHVAGVLPLLDDQALAGRVRAVWFNGYAQMQAASDLLGPLDGELLSERLASLPVAWNEGFAPTVTVPTGSGPGRQVGGPVMAPEGAPVRVPLPGGAVATILSPTPQRLRAMLPVWAKAVRDAALTRGARGRPDPAQLPIDLLGVPLPDLAKLKTARDKSPANGTSIAFVLEYASARLLLCGDAHPDVLVPQLRALGGDAPYRVDACKVPHHGSQANVTEDFVAALDCDRWLFSSNGVRFSHPDDSAVARVILGSPRPPTIVTNYPSKRWLDFAATYPPAQHGYRLESPTGVPGARHILAK